jgi:hypothetical protein
MDSFAMAVPQQVLETSFSIFTSGLYKATAPGAAFPQEKTRFAETGYAGQK